MGLESHLELSYKINLYCEGTECVHILYALFSKYSVHVVPELNSRWLHLPGLSKHWRFPAKNRGCWFGEVKGQLEFWVEKTSETGVCDPGILLSFGEWHCSCCTAENKHWLKKSVSLIL